MTDQHDPKAPADRDGAQPPAPSPDAPTHEEFAKLLATSTDAKRHARGSVVRGTIVQIGETDILVDVGARSEAQIARAELVDEAGALTVKVGDTIEATVVKADGSIRLSRKLVAGAKSKEMLLEAFRAGMPVQGRVTASIKGGYEVQVAGMRGFCPFSQIDVRRQEDPTLYFNKTFEFRIKEYEPRKRNLILSRRALIEQESKKQEAEVRAKLTEGSVLRGRVVSLMDFGAFIDLGGGVQGLLHVSEISHTRVTKPSDALSLGQDLDVQVLRMDSKKGKISLTRKPLEGDPWDGVSRRFRQGHVAVARVVRVTEFGAFVELAPGVDGLLHVSEMADLKGADGSGGPRKATDLARPGDELKVQVLKVDEAKRRISLGVAGQASTAGERIPVAPLKTGDVVTGKVERVEKFGVFIRFGPGRSGMIPNNQLGTPRGADHRKLFPVGTELTAEITEADAAGRKIRLSVTKAAGREEREAVDRYRKDASRSGAAGLSTLADAFAALKKPSPADGETQ